MMVQVRTDRNVNGSEELTRRVEGEVDTALSMFTDHLTRVDVHLRDESAGRSTGQDQRCLLEARPSGQDPVVVTNHATSMDEAVDGALVKLQSLLSSKFGRAKDHHHGGTTMTDHLPHH